MSYISNFSLLRPCAVFAATLLSSWLTTPLIAGAPVIIGKAAAPVTPQGGWRVSGGLSYRTLGDMDWITGTRSTSSLLTIGQGSNTAGIDAIGPAASLADRTYNDGFMFRDAGTDGGGDSWYWGYDNVTQLGDNNISFHGGSGTAASFAEDENYDFGGWSSDMEGVSPFIQVDWIQPYTAHLSLGFRCGLSFFHADASRTLSTFSASKTRTDYSISYTDTYDLDGSVAPLAPYAGNLAGPGILLSNIPISRAATQIISGGENASAFNEINADFDLSLSSISLGPVLEYNRAPWALQASAGLTINIASWEADQKESLFVSRNGAASGIQNQWSDRGSETEILPGFFFQFGVNRQLNENWSINAFGRYDWLDDIDFQTGPSIGTVEMSGWSLGGGVAYQF